MSNVYLTDEIRVRFIDRMGGDKRCALAANTSVSGETNVGFDDMVGRCFDGTDVTVATLPHEPPEPLTDEKVAGLIDWLVRKKHGTPFEAGALQAVVYAPIFVYREWHRHRVGWSYNEESGRYRTLRPVFHVPRKDRAAIPVKDPGVLCETRLSHPTEAHPATVACGGALRRVEAGRKRCEACGREHRYHTSASPCFGPMNDEEYAWFIRDAAEAAHESYARYEERLRRGYAKELSRCCLPVNTYSTCWITANPRSLMHFLSLRTHEPAAAFPSYPQAEIEQAARVVEQLLKEGWPLVHAAFRKHGSVCP